MDPNDKKKRQWEMLDALFEYASQYLAVADDGKSFRNYSGFFTNVGQPFNNPSKESVSVDNNKSGSSHSDVVWIPKHDQCC